MGGTSFRCLPPFAFLLSALATHARAICLPILSISLFSMDLLGPDDSSSNNNTSSNSSSTRLRRPCATTTLALCIPEPNPSTRDNRWERSLPCNPLYRQACSTPPSERSCCLANLPPPPNDGLPRFPGSWENSCGGGGGHLAPKPPTHMAHEPAWPEGMHDGRVWGSLGAPRRAAVAASQGALIMAGQQERKACLPTLAHQARRLGFTRTLFLCWTKIRKVTRHLVSR